MKALTSISPKHINYPLQKIAVDSWKKLGFDVYSFNNRFEIEILKKDFDVNFIEVETEESIYGKPLVKVDKLLNFTEGSFCIINSDIILYDMYGVMKKINERIEHSASIVKRRDFVNNINDNQVFQMGIDVFFLHSNYANKIPASDFVLGECWHDYSYPYALIKSGIDVHLVREPFAFHRMHNTQYSIQKWRDLAQHFMNVYKVKAKSAEKLNIIIYDEIMRAVK